MNLIKRNLSIFLILPYFIAVTGMLVLDSGDKKLIPFIIISIIMSLFLYKKEQLIKNIKLPFIWLLALLCVYTIFSYYYHGASSREMRALLGSTLFLLFFPYQILTQKVIQWIVLVGSFVVCINSIYFNLYIGIGRDAGYINPIPYATSCALISIIAFSLLLDDSPLKEKALPLMAFLLSLPPIVLSETRGIWLALILSMFFIIVVRCIKTPPSKKQILFTLIFTAILVYSGVFLFKDKVNERYNSTIYEIERIQSNDFSTSFGLRLQMWMLAPNLIKQKPILGHGQEQRKILKDKLRNDEISKHLYRYASAHYHNQILDKMVKSGAIGLIFLIGLLFLPLIMIKKLPSTDAYIVIGLVSLFFIAGLTDVPFNHSQTMMLYLLFIVPICSRCKRVTND
ncbi:O-antigen ligase [Vibrio cyclitrophicus]|uniref:O-antigen ligase family protein n=1 Tax=Vibrio cyclitrophicus TaxID=47951 RepID=UPI000C82FF37|nr:O-antigen ligase family protein [Vibrio cyclitrophicus]PMH39118.1 O-antigen ligase [Vibrio cyclitrophicus]